MIPQWLEHIIWSHVTPQSCVSQERWISSTHGAMDMHKFFPKSSDPASCQEDMVARFRSSSKCSLHLSTTSLFWGKSWPCQLRIDWTEPGLFKTVWQFAWTFLKSVRCPSPRPLNRLINMKGHWFLLQYMCHWQHWQPYATLCKLPQTSLVATFTRSRLHTCKVQAVTTLPLHTTYNRSLGSDNAETTGHTTLSHLHYYSFTKN